MTLSNRNDNRLIAFYREHTVLTVGLITASIGLIGVLCNILASPYIAKLNDKEVAIENLTEKCNQPILINNTREIINNCQKLINKDIAQDTTANAYINHARELTGEHPILEEKQKK
ncbi:MAG: hypothetical protein AAGE84_06710 [Cyanobacteria bacterium P01_G01_bin.39]